MKSSLERAENTTGHSVLVCVCMCAMCVFSKELRMLRLYLLSLRIKRISSLKVSLFFSRIPQTSYSTYNRRKQSKVDTEVKENKKITAQLVFKSELRWGFLPLKVNLFTNFKIFYGLMMLNLQLKKTSKYYIFYSWLHSLSQQSLGSNQ